MKCTTLVLNILTSYAPNLSEEIILTRWVMQLGLSEVQFRELSGEWFEITSTITPEFYDTKFCYQ